MAEKHLIRNSTAEFLIFQIENKEQGIEVMYADETIWCTQKAMAAVFDVGVPAISKHLANVFETGELKEDATISKMETVQREGSREVKRQVVIDAYLSSDERPVLDNSGSVSHEEAVLHAETEFEKYRIVQDRLFQSDFDKYLDALPFEEGSKCKP